MSGPGGYLGVYLGTCLAIALMVFGPARAEAKAPGPITAFKDLKDTGEPGTSGWLKTDQTALRIVSATATAGPSETLTLGLHFKMQPGWKIYWRSPGDAGFPPEVDWSRSENLKSAVLGWPAPERFSVIGLETLGYKKEVVLPITVRRADASKPLHLAGAIRYLVCDDICIPYDATVALTLAPGDGKPSPFAHLINRFAVTVPGDGKRHGLSIDGAETWLEGKTTWLRVKASAALPFQAPDAYPEGPGGLSFSRPNVISGPDGRTADLEMRVFGLKYLDDKVGEVLAGRNLTLTIVDGDRSAEGNLTVSIASGTAAKAQAATERSSAGPSLFVILGLAVLGGLILNLMPCVLPVLSIKLLSVVKHGGGERRLVRLSFLASAAGIVFAFMILAGALIALKGGGMIVGWGIQFQQPWFLIAMTLLIVAFACNLWGLFEFRLPVWVSDLGEHASHVHGLGGHFLQGAFATLLATPCSAPFLGTAVGFALARGWGEISAVFAALGIGLALPYLTVAAFPGLATRLPRPGPWMITLRRILSLALVATGVWLLSVLATNIGVSAAAAVAGLTAAGAGLLVLGRYAPKGAGRRAPIGIALAVLVAFLIPGWLGIAPANGSNGAGRPSFSGNGELGKMWTPFDEAAIPGLVQQGKTVFVDVTADWCITCQVNKGLVLNTDTMIQAFKSKGVVMMQADWTRPDAKISSYLARYQRYGIPFNAVYGPGAPEGVALPELLSRSEILDALGRASKPARTTSQETHKPKS
ncbi:MAG: thioredoxin family protein [Rhodospirillales bacterium]|nr:thioredoxin family protein [Alphaproteobacteria bacterium]MBL6947667.1 thioredoxin family protein [Rhodospirillales bacterium]